MKNQKQHAGNDTPNRAKQMLYFRASYSSKADEVLSPTICQIATGEETLSPRVPLPPPLPPTPPSLHTSVSTVLLFRSCLFALWQDGYDHSYFFISSFIEDHVSMHADRLLA